MELSDCGHRVFVVAEVTGYSEKYPSLLKA
jgi:hypothetical protein